MRLVGAMLLLAALTAGCVKGAAMGQVAEDDVLTNWGPFTIEAPKGLDPRSLSLLLSAQQQTKSTGQAKLEVMSIRNLARGALISYAISGPPSGMFRYTLAATPGKFGVMYIPPAPERRTELRQGAKFADVDGIYGAPMGVFTLVSKKRQNGALRVALRSSEERPMTLTATANSVFGLPNLLPIENDGNVMRIRRAFRRGRAWALGKIGMYCGGQPNPNNRMQPNLQVIDDRSVAIKRIMRIHGFVNEIAAGNPGWWQAEEGFHFIAVDPVVIVYARKWPGCTSSFWMLADSWQVKRFLSPVSLDEAHPEWPSAIRSALKLERVRPGMTHAMVAWARGYPLNYGTVETLNSGRRWDYETMAKYAQWAIFKGDTLVEYHGTGGWPR